MALNLDALGKPLGPVTKDYNWKDAVLYALGVGAGFDEIEYTYEKDLKVLPSFSIAAVFNFFPLFSAEANVNLAGILHGEQQLVFHQPIPAEGTLKTSGRLTHFYDKGKDKGALVVGESETWHSNVWTADLVARTRPHRPLLCLIGRRTSRSRMPPPRTSPCSTGFRVTSFSSMWTRNLRPWPVLKGPSCTGCAPMALPAGR